MLRPKLAGDCYFVMDRWYAQVKLLNQINAMDSSYVCWMKENRAFEVEEGRLLSEEALKARVVRDALVRMGKAACPRTSPINGKLINALVLEAFQESILRTTAQAQPDQFDDHRLRFYEHRMAVRVIGVQNPKDRSLKLRQLAHIDRISIPNAIELEQPTSYSWCCDKAGTLSAFATL